MKFRMLKTVQGAENGHTVETFEEGKEYDLGPNLAALFQRDKVVEIEEREAEDKIPAPKALAEMKKVELAALAKEELSLDLDADKMKHADMVAAIEAAREAKKSAG